MFDRTTFVAYLTASLAIIFAPGPAQALVLARSIGSGRRAGIVTAIGLNVATIVHALLAGLGLSAILLTSATAFQIVKSLGAAYLIYLGLKAWRQKHVQPCNAHASAVKVNRTFVKAFTTGLLNPKVGVFFLAFLPQFVDPLRGSAFLQFLVLGTILAVLDVLYESILASVAGALSKFMSEDPRFTMWRERVMGTVLIGLGLRLAFVERR
jgi:threonine/homoserine/homoserine lactone efflux protein